MTLLDRFKKDHPDMNPDEAVSGYCPEDFGYNRPNTGCDALLEPDGTWAGCESCWNQELPQSPRDSSIGEGAEKEGGADGG